MKMNCWLIAGVMLATSAFAQDNSNAGAPTPPPTSPPPVVAAPAAPAPETAAPAPAPKPIKRRHHVAPRPIHEPPVSLVPGPAQVAVKYLNVRAQAGVRGVVIGHVTKGETVTVLSQINLEKHRVSEPAQWAQIALPPGIHVWVFDRYINSSTKTVKVRRLNLRAGPSENYGVLGVIERGTSVNEIRTKGHWMEIEPPANAYAFVAAMYLKQVPPPPPQPVAVTQPAPAPKQAAPPPPQKPAPPPQPVNRVVAHEGVVGPVISPVAPTKYKLYDPDTYETIDYLYSTAPDLHLSRYVNMRIIVTGVEGIDKRWPTSPIIAIQSIQVVSTNAVKRVDLRSPRQRGNAAN